MQTRISSGGVIYRNNGDATEVALIAVRGNRYWCLPKGLIDKGETPEITAVREVREESGLNGRIIDKLGEITYWYYIKGENAKCRKTVHFYLMEYESGNTGDHDSEVDEAQWFPTAEALQKISFSGDRKILEKALDKIKALNVKVDSL